MNCRRRPPCLQSLSVVAQQPSRRTRGQTEEEPSTSSARAHCFPKRKEGLS